MGQLFIIFKTIINAVLDGKWLSVMDLNSKLGRFELGK